MYINPTSLKISQLLGSENEQYVVPTYQRRYSWHAKQLKDLLDDISLLEGTDTHLMGSIVCLTGQHTAGLNRLELVDGQQRLTTLSILLHCISERLKKDGEISTAQSIDRLLEAKALGEPPSSKIVLDSIDSDEYQRHLGGGSSDGHNENLRNAFVMFRQWVAEQKLKDLGTFLYRLQNQAIMIRLDVSDAKDAFKLFETINNRGLRLSPPDIIKNFLLGNAARFDAKSLNLAKASWARLVKDLDGVNFEAFFRYFLTAKLKRRITRSFVIANFKQLFMTLVAEAAKLPERHWYLEDEGEDDEVEAVEDNPDGVDVAHSITLPEGERVPFDTFMGDLTRSATIYGQLVRCNTGNPSIDRHLRNLRMISASQSYGFLMYLRTGECKDSEFKKVLKLTEAFLMRRHTCRLRSNDTERVFARLCSADPTAILEKVREVYREFSPSDEKFIEDFAAINFNSNIIDRARYCLEQFEFDNQGSHAELAVAGADTVHVEHIIPQKIKTHKAKDEFGDWPSYLGESAEAKHGKFVSKIGNLTLFAGALNIGASNNPYSRKAVAYEQSAIKMTNELPKKYEEFRYAEVDKRSRELAQRAAALWPNP